MKAESSQPVLVEEQTSIRVERCKRVGVFGQCELFEGHKGLHRNYREEFIQIDVGTGPQ